MEAVESSAIRGKWNLLGLALKAAVSLGLIVAVCWKVDYASVLETSRQLSGALLISVILMFAVQTYVAAWRWWVILHRHQLGIRRSTALYICLIGAFFNQLLPTSFGGDVARAWYLYRRGINRKLSVITVLSDRIVGMVALTGLAILAFPILLYFPVGTKALSTIAFIVAGASSALASVFWLDRLPGWIRHWTPIRRLGSVSEAMRDLAGDKCAIGSLLGLSLLIHAITVLAILVMLVGIFPGVNVPLCAALIPAILLIAMIPVSIAGWGVRESVMVYGLGISKVPPQFALVVSIAVGLSLAVIGLVGGLAWLRQTTRGRSRQ